VKICCKQTRLSLNNNLLLRLPEYFQDPEQFIPERWTRDRQMENVHPYLLLPFSFGARTCAGQFCWKSRYFLVFLFFKYFCVSVLEYKQMFLVYNSLRWFLFYSLLTIPPLNFTKLE